PSPASSSRRVSARVAASHAERSAPLGRSSLRRRENPPPARFPRRAREDPSDLRRPAPPCSSGPPSGPPLGAQIPGDSDQENDKGSLHRARRSSQALRSSD